jgi:hypothetical protein
MSGSYPNMLASGVDLENTFAPFELWAGESDIVTSQGTAAENIAQFTVVTYDAQARITAWLGGGGAAGTQTVTFSTAVPANGDTVTINGQAITFKTTPTGTYDLAIPGSLALAASTLRDLVNAHEDTFNATATASSGVVTLSAANLGEAGNAVTVAKSGTNIAVGGATLAGGTDQGAKPIGFMAQAAVTGGPAVFYTGGVPNHAVLIWPASVSTLDARKAAFAGTNITISALL